MQLQAAGDCFEIINGPEDGTEFPIARAPFDLGSDPGCGVSIRLDDTVPRFHARITVVAGGYRVRRISDTALFVNGSRVGRVRSRIVRAKDVITAGRTELCVRLAEGGLASRSYGLPTESDASWAVRVAFRNLSRLFRRVFGLFRGGLLSKLLIAAAVIGIASIFSPWVRAYVFYARDWVLYLYQYLLFQLGIGY
ncbi:MAG: FHA domain-containing protein [Candidatus Hydrogenedens sp.]|nr:FHA domain-containing protein [Candidatus Hydrogenedens sp.]